MIEVESLVAADGSRMSRRLFHDAAIYELEQQRIFQRCWLFVGHESQVPSAGDYVTSYMGEVPVIVSRDSEGAVHVVVNSCAHRATRVCTDDSGNAQTFTCPYHGWTYTSTGQLLGVPRFALYDGALDKARYGLLTVRVETYLGLIFATFDDDAVSLAEYLGDEYRFYLENVLDRDGEGWVTLGGVSRWRLDCNWKIPAENLSADTYHTGASGAHASLRADLPAGYSDDDAPGNTLVTTPEGHGIVVELTKSADDPRSYPAQGQAARTWFDSVQPKVRAHLGEHRACVGVVGGTVFPNLNVLPQFFLLRVCHPRGPQEAELWTYHLVPAAAPPDARAEMSNVFTSAVGPGGMVEAEDGEVWVGMTRGACFSRADDRMLHVGLAMGTEHRSDELLGVLGPRITEQNQRGYWRAWRRWVSCAQ